MKLIKKTIAIILSAAFIVGGAGGASAESIADLKKQQDELRSKTVRAKDYLNDAQIEKSGVLGEVLLLDIMLDEAEQELDEAEAELELTVALLEKTETELVDAEVLREAQYESLKGRVRYMHENGVIGYLEILLKSESFADFVNRLEYVDEIINYDNNIVKNLAETERLVTEKASEIELHKRETELLRDSRAERKARLEEAIEEKNAAVYELTKNELTFQQQIRDLEESDRQIQRLIKAAEDESARVAAEKAAAARAAEQKAEDERDAAEREARLAAERTKYIGGQLAWPVPDYYTVSSGYGSRTNPISGKSEFHTGIDIAAPSGANVVAAGDGTVILSGYNGGYGYTVIIDHGGGMTTLYGHNSKLYAENGATVKRGELIAKCGSTGYSTGPHVHFEVRKNGSSESPMGYVQK